MDGIVLINFAVEFFGIPVKSLSAGNIFIGFLGGNTADHWHTGFGCMELVNGRDRHV